jgi:hypothetical protein
MKLFRILPRFNILVLCTTDIVEQIAGVDGKGYAFQRITPTAISALNPSAPRVKLPPFVRGYFDTTVTLTCVVESLVPFEVFWSKNDEPIGNTLYYR